MTTSTSALPAATSTHASTLECTAVSAACPVDATIYGYYPDLAANLFFCALFALCCILHLGLGFWYRSWTFMIALSLGCLAEAVGYVGRVLLHDNPWSNAGFEMQICCLIIAPAFIAAGVYLTLKHFTLSVSAELSPLKPRLYTWIFIACDLLSLILQGAGGGTAATANDNLDMQKIGNDLMMAGIVWQVITLLVFGALAVVYCFRVRGALRRNPRLLSESGHKLLSRPSFKAFTAAIVLAYLTIFTRCVYRIGEMANGWRNSIMQDETDFIVLDSVMIAIATVCLTVFHPGWTFPEMQTRAYDLPDFDAAKEVSDVESSPERYAVPQYVQRVQKKKGGLFNGA